MSSAPASSLHQRRTESCGKAKPWRRASFFSLWNFSPITGACENYLLLLIILSFLREGRIASHVCLGTTRVRILVLLKSLGLETRNTSSSFWRKKDALLPELLAWQLQGPLHGYLPFSSGARQMDECFALWLPHPLAACTSPCPGGVVLFRMEVNLWPE